MAHCHGHGSYSAYQVCNHICNHIRNHICNHIRNHICNHITDLGVSICRDKRLPALRSWLQVCNHHV